MRVATDTAIIAEAERIERIVLKKLVSRPVNYTGLKQERRFYVGTLGELAFGELLRKQRIKFKEVRRTDGHSDSCDFYVWRKGERAALMVDVKTAGQEWYTKAMIPLAQWTSTKKDLYVGARLVQGAVEFHGFATRKEVGSWKRDVFGDKGVMTLYKELSQLRSMEEFFAALETTDDADEPRADAVVENPADGICPKCGSLGFRRSTLSGPTGTTELLICAQGCTGRSIAVALSLENWP